MPVELRTSPLSLVVGVQQLGQDAQEQGVAVLRDLVIERTAVAEQLDQRTA